jgi:opacity protein-like surface antigen
MQKIVGSAVSLFVLSAWTLYAGTDMKSTSSTAESSDAGFYVGAFGGINASQSFEDGYTKGTSPSAATAIASVQDADTIGGAGGVKFGYHFDSYEIGGDFRLQPAVEVEAFYLGTRMDLHANVSQSNLPAAFSANAKGNLDEAAFFVNGLVRFKNGSIFTPYVGGGIGGMYMSTSDVNFNINANIPGLGSTNLRTLNSNLTSDDFVFATQAIVGCDVAIARHWDLFSEYKFVVAVDPSFNYSSITTSGDNYDINPDFIFQHLFTVGIKYNF